MPNRLARESSPYLLQHAENPVDWYPWGEEALSRAKVENKPIFLSIGYSACHWCHVMEHESFENEAIAQFLNEHFISIKVDREERPDLDQIYMHAVMALQRGQGGWPLSAFLTPDCHVFFGGTYWPPHDSRGMPGFDRVIRSVLDAFVNRRSDVDEQSAKVTEYLNSMTVEDWPDSGGFAGLEAEEYTRIGESLERIFDFEHGGFGRAPKFPHAMDLEVLMRLQYREAGQPSRPPADSRWMKMVHLNLEKMSLGGIYDHLAGGFARYSVDERWLVPHFEKMLYDNALLSNVLLDAFAYTGNELYRTRVKETFDYQLTYMTDDAGGFHSTEDADSEGEEGKFYVWTPDEIIEVLGPDRGRLFCDVYGVTATGNFEGKNILNLNQPLERSDFQSPDGSRLSDVMSECRSQLLNVRDRRVRPGKDDKVLVSWNALMIHAMARGGRILQEERYLDAALAAARFVESHMLQEDGTSLYHTWRNGKPSIPAFLDDYACLINAAITLYECSGDEHWLQQAIRWVEQVVSDFHDPQGGGFFFTASTSEKLIARSKEFQDSSVPSGNAMMVCALARLHQLTGNDSHRDLAFSTAAVARELIARAPSAAGQMISGIDRMQSPGQEIVICCEPPDRRPILEAVFASWHPNRSICFAGGPQNDLPIATDLLEGRQMANGQPTVYVCENHSCREPLTGLKAIEDFFRGIQ